MLFIAAISSSSAWTRISIVGILESMYRWANGWVWQIDGLKMLEMCSGATATILRMRFLKSRMTFLIFMGLMSILSRHGRLPPRCM